MASPIMFLQPQERSMLQNFPFYAYIPAKDGQIILTPVRIQRADAVRAKLAALDLSEQDVSDAVAWARKSGGKIGR